MITAEIDLGDLWNITKQHPDLVGAWTGKDGAVHKTIRLMISELKNPSEHKTHFVKVNVPKDKRDTYKDINLFIGNAKLWPDNNNAAPQQQAAAPVAQAEPTVNGNAVGSDDFPF